MNNSIRSKYHEVLRDSWTAKASDYATDIELGAPVWQSRRAAKLENIINLISIEEKELLLKQIKNKPRYINRRIANEKSSHNES